MSNLTQQLATRADQEAAGTPAVPGKRPPTLADIIEQQRPQLARALPRHLDADRFARIVLTECRRNPGLLQCTPASMLGAMMQAAQLGLEPGPLQQCYLVPYKGEVTFQVGYRGFIDLFRRATDGTIVAREVCENDEFELEYEEGRDRLRHVPNLRQRGEVYAYYGLARMPDGSSLVHVMTQDEVDRHKARSKTKDNGPWKTDPVAMGRKTVIRAMSPYLPASTEVALALESDEKVYDWNGEPDGPVAQVLAPSEPPAIDVPPSGQPDATADPVVPPEAQESPPASPELTADPPAGLPDGWESEAVAVAAHEWLTAEVQQLTAEQRAIVQDACPQWPLTKEQYDHAVHVLGGLMEAEIEGDAAREPQAPSEGPAEAPADAGDVGPAGPSPTPDAAPTGDPGEWSVGQLRDYVDRHGLPADRRSRDSMADAVRGHTPETLL